MKKFLLALVIFIVSLFLGLLFMLPYKNIYDNAINGYLKNMNVQVVYKISKASPFFLKANNILIKKEGYLFHFDAINAKVFPLHYIFGGILFKLRLESANRYANIDIGKEDKNKWYINVNLPSSVIKSSARNLNLPILLKGNLLAAAKIERESGELIIRELSVRGMFHIDAQGYIKNHYLMLNGKIKFGKTSQNFSFSRMF